MQDNTTEHALAYGEHTAGQCGEWCSFPTGNEGHRLVPHRIGDTVFGRRYLWFHCSGCPYSDFVVGDDDVMVRINAMEAFTAVDGHSVEIL